MNVNFPLKSVKKVRIKLVNSGGAVRVNGFKVYTPLLDSGGLPLWPRNSVTWSIKLNAIVSGS